MKAGILAAAAVTATIVAIGFAVHFELSARTRVQGDLRRLRVEAAAELGRDGLTPAQAAALETRLGQARRDMDDDDVRGAQKLLDSVKLQLQRHPRSA